MRFSGAYILSQTKLHFSIKEFCTIFLDVEDCTSWKSCSCDDVFGLYRCCTPRYVAPLGAQCRHRMHIGNYGMTLIIIYKMMKIMGRNDRQKSCSCIIGRHKSTAKQREREALIHITCAKNSIFGSSSISIMIDSSPIYI